MSGIEKRIKKHACIFVKDLSFISVRYNSVLNSPQHYISRCVALKVGSLVESNKPQFQNLVYGYSCLCRLIITLMFLIVRLTTGLIICNFVPVVNTSLGPRNGQDLF